MLSLSALLSEFKIYIILLLVGAICYGLFRSHAAAYDAGANSVALQYEEKSAKLAKEENDRIAAALLDAKKDSENQRAAIVARLNEQRALNKELEEINNEINHAIFDCSNTGTEFLRLFNAPIRAANCSIERCGDPGVIESASPAPPDAVPSPAG